MRQLIASLALWTFFCFILIVFFNFGHSRKSFLEKHLYTIHSETNIHSKRLACEASGAFSSQRARYFPQDMLESKMEIHTGEESCFSFNELMRWKSFISALYISSFYKANLLMEPTVHLCVCCVGRWTKLCSAPSRTASFRVSSGAPGRGLCVTSVRAIFHKQSWTFLSSPDSLHVLTCSVSCY